MQMKEIHSKKEVSGISRNKNGRKHKKRKEDQITYRTMKIRKDQLRPCMGRNKKGQTHKPRNVLHMDRNATISKRGITAQDFV